MNPAPPPPADSPATSRALRLLVFAVAGVALWLLTRNWHASLLDRYEFRQLQTALTAFWIQREGFRLDYLTPLFGPPWSIPMEFPTYQTFVALCASLTGLPLEQSGRLVGVLFFAATFPALYDLLAAAGLPPRRRLVALLPVLATPVYLFYARAFLIETAALCLVVWFLALYRRALERPTPALVAAAALAAVAAALTKVTTFAIGAVPAAALALAALAPAWRSGLPRARALGATALAALPAVLALAFTLWWLARGDALKHSNPFTGFLASTELREWNYGTLALRLEPSFWLQALHATANYVLSEGTVALALLCAAFAPARARLAALAGAAAYAAGPLVFANLYHIHDYYYAANALFLSAAAGVLLAAAWDHPRFPAAARWIALSAALAFQFQAFNRTYAHYLRVVPPAPPGLALVARAALPEDGVLLVYGDDWNPTYAYYAQRRALMVPGQRDDETAVLEDILARLPPHRIAGLLFVGPERLERRDFIAERTTRFGLAAQPFAADEKAELYLASGDAVAAARRLAGNAPDGVRVLLAPSPDAAEEAAWGAQEFPAGSLAPVVTVEAEARSRFGLSLGELEGRPAVHAHAPSVLRVAPPPGARTITAVIGLPAAAYAAPPPSATDGVTVEIHEEHAGGLRQLLVRRELRPSARPEDRGWQELRWENPRPFTGRILLRITPGPDGNPTNDWTAWAGVRFE